MCGQVGTWPHAFTYDQHLVLEAVPKTAPASPSPTGIDGLITVIGDGFTSADVTPRSAVGSTACAATFWKSRSSVLCRVSAGIGEEHPVLVSIFNVFASKLAAFNYLSPRANETAQSNLARDRQAHMVLLGMDFGRAAYSAQVRAGGSAAGTTVWISDSSLSCSPARTVSPEGAAVVISMQGEGTSNNFISHDLPTIADTIISLSKGDGKLVFGASNVLAEGGPTLLLTGVGFGSFSVSSRTRLGGSASLLTQWFSNTAVECKPPGGTVTKTGPGVVNEGLGRWMAVVLTMSSATASLTNMVSYDLPSTARVLVRDSNGKRVGYANMKAFGGGFVLIVGSGFGQLAQTIRGSTGSSVCERTLWFSNTLVECKAARGQAREGSLIASVGGLVGTATQMLSHDAPTLRTLQVRIGSRMLGRTNFAPADSFYMVVNGKNLGPAASYTEQGRLGVTAMEETAWLSDLQVEARVSRGIGPKHTVVLSAGLLAGSLTSAASYDVCTVHTLASQAVTDPGSLNETALWSSAKANVCGDGVVLVGVAGHAFGSFDATAKLRLGSQCEHTLWRSETAVLGRLSSGRGASVGIVMSVGTQRNSVTATLSYLAPALTAYAALQNAPTHGGSYLKLQGPTGDRLNLNWSPQLRLASSSCQRTAWESSTLLTCLAGRGLQSSSSIAITVGAIVGSQTESASYDLPPVTGTQGQSNSAGKTFPGLSFLFESIVAIGLAPGSRHLLSHSLGVRLHSTAVQQSVWQSETSVVLKMAPALVPEWGPQSRVVVTAGVSVGSAPASTISYDIATVSTAGGANVPPSPNGTLVTLHGNAFARSGASIAARIGWTAAESSIWIAESSCSARAAASPMAGSPQAGGNGRSLVVTSSVMGAGSISEALSFDTALLQAVEGRNGPATPLQDLTVLGSGFGLVSSSLGLRVGHTACVSTEWHSDSSASCRYAYNLGDAFRIALS